MSLTRDLEGGLRVTALEITHAGNSMTYAPAVGAGGVRRMKCRFIIAVFPLVLAVAGRASAAGEDGPVDFHSEVVPLLTRYGCNAGACHGKALGQNGFKLSLLGFDPQSDYEQIVRASRGRRVFPAAPDHSLLLLKPMGRLPHGGGVRLDPDGRAYAL